jgi:hypothetical protein
MAGLETVGRGNSPAACLLCLLSVGGAWAEPGGEQERSEDDYRRGVEHKSKIVWTVLPSQGSFDEPFYVRPAR